MSFKTPSIKQQFENRNQSNMFIIQWFMSYDENVNPIEDERFGKEAKKFVKEVNVHEEIQYLSFDSCPLDFIGKNLSIWFEKFPKVEELKFIYCHLNTLNFIGMEKIKQKLNIQSLNFRYCNIPKDNSLSQFLKGQKIKSIKLDENNMKEETLVKVLKEVSKMNTLISVFIQEDILRIDNTEITTLTKSCLENLPSLLNFILRVGEINIEENKDEVQDLLDNHSFLLLFELGKNIFNIKNLKERLKHYVSINLKDKYDRLTLLNECQVLFMGDGRVGKTSTIRSLFDRSFLLDNNSTLVLNDIDIFSIKPNNYNWNSISKYELSVQRVKNSLPTIVYSYFDPNPEVQTKYKLDFEKELLSRTVSDEKFIESMKTHIYGFATIDVYFRIYDFGGQEIFSSIHHIFMNSNSLYFLVFNMTKISQNDLFRLKFWCESILKNTEKAPVIFIGTYLKRYKKKNVEDTNLEKLQKKLQDFVKSLSSELNIMKNDMNIFFPIENSKLDSQEKKNIKDKIKSLVSGAAGINKENFLNFRIETAKILFLDNCREQTNIMTLKEFEDKSYSCGFEVSEVQDMLEIYSKAGLICYFPNLDLEVDANFIFFAPSYLAQALGKFIRDPNFHELAFRIPSNKFSLYRIYVDKGKLNKELFNILLKEYSDKEKKYILSLALKNLVLIPVEIENDVFILPELLPELKRGKIKPSFRTDIQLIFGRFLLLSTFVILVDLFKSQEEITQSFVYKGFARMIFGTEYVFDIFISSDKSIAFTLVQSNHKEYLNNLLEIIIPKFRNRTVEDFEILDTNREVILKPTKKRNNFFKSLFNKFH
eukprot:snap_masked-scaffold_57-processed-gene-0.49-mRNA-1 protein AED:1.00 eAED:1.00 QI:0/0/0/0/1/1/8/0/819